MAADLATLLTVPNAVAGLVLALGLLAAAIAGVRRAVGAPELARVAVAPQQEIRLDATGPVVLYGEGPRFTGRFAGLAFRLVERASGQAVPQRAPWVHTTVAGWSRVRLALARFEIARAGAFRLEVSGLASAAPDDACAFVFAAPTGLRLPIAIVGCVLAGAATVGTLVALGWILVASPSTRGPHAVNLARPGSIGTPAGAASGGRQLAATAASSEAAHDVRWNGPGLVVHVPADWEVRDHDAELDVRAPARASAYLVGHFVLFPSPTRADMLSRVALESAAERLAAGLIEGYEAVRWAGIDGVLTIEARDDGASRMAVWNAYRPTAKGVQNVTVLFGADGAEFDRLAPVARAAFASARFD